MNAISAKGKAMSNIKMYGHLLSALADKFNNMDFKDYSPSEVINRFWSERDWHNQKVNLFDLILMARGNKPLGKNRTTDLDEFLDDFASFMIASYTIHYMNQGYHKMRRPLTEEEAHDVEQGIRFDFLGKILGM